MAEQISPLAAMAGGGNEQQTGMFQQLMETSQKKQSYLEQQQAAYNADMEKYAQMVSQSQQPESREAMMWGNMAGAAASVAPTWGNIGAMLGKTGEAYGKSQEYDQQMNLRNQSELTKLRQNEVRALESKDQMASLYKALYGGAAGKPLTPEQLRTVYTGARNEAAQIAKDYDWKSAEERAAWIENYATKAVTEYQTKFGLNTGATYGSETSPAPAGAPRQTQSEQVPQEGIGAGSAGEGTVETTPAVTDLLSPQDAELATRLITRINANPAAAKADTARLEQLLMKYQTGAPAQAPTLEPVKRDKPKEEMTKETGKAMGKALAEEHQGLMASADSSAQMIGQLDLLKKLYQTPNMPEGELGEHMQHLRSGLKSLGIEVGPEVPAADLVEAISGKMALLTRTADGKNLMPGAMTDFEQRLLRGLVPGLRKTAEGRTALIDVMQSMARARIRMAEEASKMAADNRGILPGEWNSRKLRIMKEEMARLSVLNKQLAAQMQGAPQ